MFGKDKKKRSRRVNTKYGQKTLKHARKGIQSCMMAVLCAVILIVMILVSFLMNVSEFPRGWISGQLWRRDLRRIQIL